MRAELRAARRAFAAGRGFLSDQSHLTPLRALISQSRCIAGYWPMGGEADARAILANARKNGALVALPRFTLGEPVMRFHLWAEGDPLDSYRGYAMPCADAPIATPDLILTPLVGFDRGLNRLGQGQGHYDRAFAAYPETTKVGIAWSVQEVDSLPLEPHDVPLDAILTEKEWITR